MREAFSDYKLEVKERKFPGVEHTVVMNEEEWQRLEEKLTQQH
jgi:hypothetical protein